VKIHRRKSPPCIVKKKRKELSGRVNPGRKIVAENGGCSGLKGTPRQQKNCLLKWEIGLFKGKSLV